MIDDATELRHRLSNPKEVCSALGLLEHARRQSRGVLIRCPAHGDRTPSCSVTLGPDGTIRVRCFACDLAGDVFDLIGAVFQLNPRRDFRAILKHASDLCGYRLNTDLPRPSAPPHPPPPPPRPYPPSHELSALWHASVPITTDHDATTYFEHERGLNVTQLEALDLIRIIPIGLDLPHWAAYQARSWAATNHRGIVPMFDDSGILRSIRAIRLSCANDLPKRLPPAGFRAGGIVMANDLARTMLTTGNPPGWWTQHPFRLLICEGEPDWLTWASRFSEADETAPAVLGIVSGSWTPRIAARVPTRSRVIVRTHNDSAGSRYAEEINATLGHRCAVLRSKGDAHD